MVNAGVTSLGILVAVYYGLAAIACTVYYRRALPHNMKGLIFAGIFPILSAAFLFVLAGYLIVNDWTSSDTIAVDATNGKFLVIVPIGVMLSRHRRPGLFAAQAPFDLLQHGPRVGAAGCFTQPVAES